MKAAVFLGDRQFTVTEDRDSEPGPGEVLVRLEGCGVCASNLPVWQGRPWFEYPLDAGSPGHEPWGRVVALGEGVTSLEVGQRVTGLTGRAYAEYDVAPAEDLVPLPPRFDHLPFPGEAFGCVMNIYARTLAAPGMEVAVIGAGFIGGALVQLLRADGSRPTAFSRRPWSRAAALAQGAVATRPLHADSADRGRWPRVIDCTGTQEGLDLATALVAPGGRLVIAGFHQDGLRTIDMQEWNWKGIDVVNAHERDHAVALRGIRSAIAAIEERRLDPWPLMSHRFGIDELDQAFHALESRPDGFIKGYLAL